MVNGQKENKIGGGTPKERRQQVNNSAQEAKKELPLSKTDSENLSQLQTLHYITTYIIKEQSFKSLNFKKPNQDFIFYNNEILQQILFNQKAVTETLSGFIIVLSRDRNLLYVSENVVEYLGLRATEVLLSCDTLEDVLHPNDAKTLYEVFSRANSKHEREFYCTWNASKIKRRVHSKADAKVFKINGHFIANGNLFVATCTPMLRSINKEYLVGTSPNCFTSIHSLDLKFSELCEKGQNILDYSNNQIDKYSLYDIFHSKDLDLIRIRHKNLLNTKSQKGKVDTVKILKRDGTYINCLINLYYSVNNVIICKYQLLSENEVYHYANYMSSLTETTQIDGADSAAEYGDDVDTQSSIDHQSIDSLFTEISGYEEQYSSATCCNNNQTAKKRKFSESSENENNTFDNSHKHQRLSIDSNTSIRNEQMIPNSFHEIQNIGRLDFTNNLMSLDNTQFMATQIPTVHENKIYPPFDNCFITQNNEVYLTEQQNYNYYKTQASPSSSLSSEMENSRCELSAELDLGFFLQYLNEDLNTISTLPDLSHEINNLDNGILAN